MSLRADGRRAAYTCGRCGEPWTGPTGCPACAAGAEAICGVLYEEEDVPSECHREPEHAGRHGPGK